MQTRKIKSVIAYEGIQAIEVENNLSPLSIEVSDDEKIQVQIECLCEDSEADMAEYLISNEFDGKTVSLILDYPDRVDERKIRISSVKVLIPNQIKLEVQTENNPVAIRGLKSNITVQSENAPIAIANCEGDLELKDENGPIRIQDFCGNINAEIENGPLSADNISGNYLHVTSENGPVKIRTATYPKVELINENGVLYYETLPVEDADFSFENENGMINIKVPDGFEFEMRVHSENGSVKCRFEAEIEHKEDEYVIRRGNSSNQICVRTENGSVKIGASDSFNIDYIKAKLNQIKASILASKDLEDNAEIQKTLSNLIDYINKNLSSIDEDKIRKSITRIIDKLRSTMEGISTSDTKQNVIDAVDEMISKINSEAGDYFRKFKDKFEQEFDPHRFKKHVHEHFSSVFDKEAFKKAFDPLKKMKHFHFEMRNEEKEKVAEYSRMKILSMLESGKINAEEAERLLKAIGKE